MKETEAVVLDGLSRRTQGLLAYLACQSGMRAERVALADLLWTDRSDTQARASLRQELSVMRKMLGPAVDANRLMVWLSSDAVETRRGPELFLQRFDLASEGFEEWLRARR